MNITGIQSPLNTDLLAKSPQAVVDAWKVGQLVNATAVSAQKNGQATVNINGALLLAQTQFPLKPGQPLQLEVSSLAAMTVLKVIADSNGKSGSAPPIIVSLQPQTQLLSQLQPGQQLSALLTQPADPKQTSTLLELAGNRFNVQLSQPLPTAIGQQIKLEVVTPGAIPALKILVAPQGNAQTAANPAVISQALRNTLPQQAPLPPLLSNLALIAKNSGANFSPGVTASPAQGIAPPLPQPLVELVRTVVDRLPRSETITTGDGLKQAVAQSGLFMEAKLAQVLQQPVTNNATPPIDFKGGLLSLLLTLLNFTKGVSQPVPQPNAPPTQNTQHAPTSAQATLHQHMNLQQALSELLRSVEKGLARLQLSQLVSSAPDDDGKRAWVMELPLRSNDHIDLIQLRIEKGKNQGQSKKAVMWTVTLTLELAGLGPVQARVTLADKTVSTHFWAEQAHTTEFIQQHLSILQSRYREVGLTVGTLDAHHGKAPDPVAPDAHMPHILLDEKV